MYWYDSLRAPVEFDRAVGTLTQAGHAGVRRGVPASRAGPGDLRAGGTGTLRRDDGGPGRFLAALAAVHVQGVPVDWAAVLGGGQQVDLPTYAFERQRFWPRPAAIPVGDVSAAGLGATGHPLLGAAVELAGTEGYMFTGRLSLRTQPWLADHAVAGTVLLPGTAFVEMAVQAGNAAGCGRIAELALEAPLVLAADVVRVQVVVDGPDASGGRDVRVYARPGEAGGDAAWTRHASGRLVPDVPPAAGLAEEFMIWPPPGAAPLPLEGWYDVLAAGGYGYGPSFRGLRAAWRRGDEVFAEVALPGDSGTSAGSFGIHPALLDAALHAAGLAGTGADEVGVRLPFAWTGVSVYSVGPAVLRVRLLRPSGGLSLTGVDGAGRPAVSVESLVSRPVTMPAAGPPDDLFAVEWVAGPGGGEAGASPGSPARSWCAPGRRGTGGDARAGRGPPGWRWAGCWVWCGTWLAAPTRPAGAAGWRW